jgi:hypothetical protein
MTVFVSAASFLKDKSRDLVDKIESNKLSRKWFENWAATIMETLDILCLSFIALSPNISGEVSNVRANRVKGYCF